MNQIEKKEKIKIKSLDFKFEKYDIDLNISKEKLQILKKKSNYCSFCILQ